MKPTSSVMSGSQSYLSLGYWAKRLRDRHVRHYQDSYFRLWADLLLVGILAGLVICIIWLRVWQPAPDLSMTMRWDNPSVTSGQQNTLVISYQNNESVTLENAGIALRLPPGVRFVSASVSPAQQGDALLFSIGSIKKGAEGEVRVLCDVMGGVPEQQIFFTDTRYYDGFAQKRILNDFYYEISGSVLATTLSLPERIYIGTSFRGEISLTNTGGESADVDLLFPAKEVEIELDNLKGSGNSFLVKGLAAGETRTIGLTGRVAKGTAVGKVAVRSEAAFLLDGRRLVQSAVERNVECIEPSLDVAASFSDSSVSATSGSATLQLAIANLSPDQISDIVFEISSARSGVALDTVASQETGSVVRGRSLALNGTLAPGEKLARRLDLSFSRERIQPEDFAAFLIIVHYKQKNEDYEYALSPGSIRFDSNLNLSSAAYYYGPQGDQLGVGPVPPVVGIPTTYWIIWQINNLGNNISGLQVMADIPSSIAWNDQTSVTTGQLDYSPITGRVVWKPDLVAASGGNYRASFAVTIVPKPGQVGTTPDLVSNIVMQGRDTFTGKTITKKSSTITTKLEKDALSAGKGEIRAED